MTENKISIEDTVGKFIPGYIHKSITIEQLLTHTSGIPNYTSRNDYLSEIMTREMPLLEIVMKYCSDSSNLNPVAGSDIQIPGYPILGAIIENATNKTYGQVLKERIFEPLTMDNSGFGVANINSKGYWYNLPEPDYNINNVAGLAE